MCEDDVVVISLHLSPQEVKALEQVQQLSGCATLEETIRKGLRLHGIEEVDGVLRKRRDYEET